jgi:hypothetical protein
MGASGNAYRTFVEAPIPSRSAASTVAQDTATIRGDGEMEIENSHGAATRERLRHESAYRHPAYCLTWPPRAAAAQRTARGTGAVAGAYRAVDSSARRG